MTNPSFPNLTNKLFLTDGGLETTLIFLEGYELPYFAAFHLLENELGIKSIKDYYRRYLKIAKDFNTGFILESPTWRANPDWIKKLGYPDSAISTVNKKAVQLIVELQKEFETEITDLVLSGCVGPRGDGYKINNAMTAEEAEHYHYSQIKAFSETSIHMISAITMNYAEESIGIVRAAATVNLPVVVSFTVEVDGKLPSGMSLSEAIAYIDKSVEIPPLYYMINCAHPTHFSEELKKGRNEQWTKRIKGIRCNSSCKSHAELDEATELDRGNIQDLAKENSLLKIEHNQLNIFGGCCGTDEEHISAIAGLIRSL